MSSSLAEKIQSDLVAAMKARDEVTLSVLRMLKSSLQVAATEKGRGDTALSDDDVQALIRRAVKQREEAAGLYRNAGAPERAESELREAKVLMAYLPAQLSDGELEALVKDAITATGASGMKDMGRVMGAAVKSAAGRADSKRVKDVLTRLLQG